MADEGNTLQADDKLERAEGVLDDNVQAFALDLKDSEILSLLSHKINASKKFWNSKKIKLNAIRKRNQDYWLGKQLEEKDFYDYQSPHVDNRIFLSVETVVPIAVSRPPEPVVTEAKDTDESRELAHNLQKVLLTLFENKLMLRSKFRMAARHLILYRLGCLKYRWDAEVEELAVDWVRPQKLIIDHRVVMGHNPSFIAEYREATLEELTYKFPDKKEELWKKYGVVRGTRKQLGTPVGYLEIWFSYFNKKSSQKEEAVCWKLDNLILDKIRNPNWNYEDEEGIYNNHLKFPEKPYVFLNYLNLGRYFIDDLAMIDNAIPCQDALNKRSRQIIENSDAANSGWVFNEEFLSKEEAGMLTGAFDERVVGHGDVRMGAARIPPPILPDYVLQDKYDQRNEIDNFMSTHQPMRGEKSNLPTLGQEVMSKQGDFGRVDDLVQEAIEPAAIKLYNGLVQLMKVYYDEEQFVKYTDKDGHTSFITFSRDKIEDGTEITIKAGTTLPVDKVSRRTEALDLAKAQLIDPITLYERLDWADPKEKAKRLWQWMSNPEALFVEEGQNQPQQSPQNGQQMPLNGEQQQVPNGVRQAMMNVQQINAGDVVPAPLQPDEAYLSAYGQFIKSPDFQQLSPEVKKLHAEHLSEAAQNAKSMIGGA